MATRDTLHQLVDTLPERELPEAERLLKALSEQDPMLRPLLAAPWDDEPTTPEEDAGAAIARREITRGDFLTAEEAKRELLG